MTTYRNPVPTVDVIIEIAAVDVSGDASGDASGDDGPVGIVLIERKNPPHGWALPGGFVDYGESVADAARREAKEETGLDVELSEQFFCYSNPARDARQHTMSVVFIGRASGQPEGADDAARAQIFTRATLPESMAFDHGQIVSDYFEYRASGRRPPPDR